LTRQVNVVRQGTKPIQVLDKSKKALDKSRQECKDTI